MIVIVQQTKRAWSAYEIDADAVKEAAVRLGLKHDVRIVRRHMHRNCGNHAFGTFVNPNGSWIGLGHDISVSSLISADLASQTIYHELQHAVQHERNGRDFPKMYKRNPQRYEDDATRAEAQHDRHPLTREVPR